MNELIMFGMARKFSSHWLRGPYLPEETMRRWMHGEIGVLAATTDCTHPDPVGRWLARTSGSVVRGIHAFVTRDDQDRFLMQDDEMEVMMSAWTGYRPVRIEEPQPDRDYTFEALGSMGKLDMILCGLFGSRYFLWRTNCMRARYEKDRRRKDRAA